MLSQLIILFTLINSVPAFATSTSNPMQLNLLNDTYSTTILRAKCLDGSPPAYYIRKGQGINSTKYIIYFQGGGWCYTLKECLARSTTPLGSSTSYPNSIPANQSKGGIVDPTLSKNPNFYTWTHVYVPYCDGTSWSGNQQHSVPVENKAENSRGKNSQSIIWYRGRNNMIALVKALQRDQNLNQATDVIIDGGSAGGLTVLLHADFFHSLLQPSTHTDDTHIHTTTNYTSYLLPTIATQTRFGAIGDAGWFRPSVQLDNKNYTALMKTMYRASNATTDQSCMNSNSKDPSNCVFASVVFPYLTSKMFVLEGAYDSWQLANVMGFPCASYWQNLTKCTAQQNQTLELYGTSMKESIQKALVSTTHHAKTAGTFVSQCIIHVQSSYNEYHDVWHDKLYVNGLTPHDVVSDWYFRNTGGRVIEDCGSFGCNPYCQSYT